MTTSEKNLGVDAIVQIAADEYGLTMRDLTAHGYKGAWRQKIRRALKDADLKNPVTGNYEASSGEAQELVHGLRHYFYKSLGLSVSEVEQREGDVSRLRANLSAARDARETGWSDEEQEPWSPSFEIKDQDFDRLMLKALFRKAFPEFDEARFRKDYEELAFLPELLQYPDPNSVDDLRTARRYESLDRKVRPAVEHGELDAYLPRRGERANG